MKYIFVVFLAVYSYLAVAQSDTLNVNINVRTIAQVLSNSPHEIKVGVGQSLSLGVTVLLPYKNGLLRTFKLIEYDVVPIALRKGIKTYYGQMVDDPSVTCRVTLANDQLFANFLAGGESIIIEKNNTSDLPDAYWIYQAEQTLPSCEIENLQKNIDSPMSGNTVMFNSHGTQLRTYRLALLITNTLYAAGGGTDAAVNAYVVSIINNINGIFEKEIAVRFTLVSPNNPVSTNVFYNYGTGSTSLSAIRPETLTRFGTDNFDVGHCIRSSGGGVANLGVVCNSSFKGGGLSGVSPSNILIFAHELGHQFNAGHTFNGNSSGNCGPDNRMNNDAFEPGSGNTIMSYANLCSPSSYNITGGKVPYFHTHSQTTMIQHITNRPIGCGLVTNTGNAPPVVSLENTVIIPKNTPFVLSGSAADFNNDPLTFTWEQYNLAPLADVGRLGNTTNSSGISAVQSTTAPLFRSTQASTGIRNFPSLTYVLNNGNNSPDNIGEDLPNVERTMNFRLTARDNKDGGGGVSFKEIVVTVADSGPFELLTGNEPTLWFAGQTTTIKWNVNSTNLAPVNCTQVKILTSVNGGSSFSTLIASTPNDGSYVYTVPNTPTNQFRIRIEAVGNVFYDINNVNITISDGTCQPETSQLVNSSSITAPVGSSSLVLNQVVYGNQIASYSSDITSNSPSSTLIFTNLSGVCDGPYSNAPQHELLTFIAASSGNTTFSFTAGTLPSKIFNIYAFPYNAISQCQNWLNSSAVETSPRVISRSSSMTQNLQAGSKYQLRVSGFSSGHQGTFLVSFSGNNLYDPVPNVNSPYAYTYVIYNLVSGVIITFQDNPDLTTFTSGSYRLYGLSYQGGFDLTPFSNTQFSNFQTLLAGGSLCGKLSSNFRNVNITEPCPTSISLTSPTNNITSGTVKQEVSGIITASNTILGGNVNYDAGKGILLSPGFSVNRGVIFSAYIDGCGGQ